jgi:hypothetical protein
MPVMGVKRAPAHRALLLNHPAILLQQTTTGFCRVWFVNFSAAKAGRSVGS